MSTEQTAMQESGGGLKSPQANPQGQLAAPEPSTTQTSDVQESAGSPATTQGSASVVAAQASAPSPPEQSTSTSGSVQGDIDMTDAGGPDNISISDRQRLIQDIISVPRDATAIMRACAQNIPDNCDINYKQLKVILHPDRFVSPADKPIADEAFKRVSWAEGEIEKRFPSELDRNHHFFQGGGSDSEQHVEGELSSYHKQAHEEATPFIQSLYFGFQKDPRVNLYQGPIPAAIRTPAEKLEIINKKIREGNSQLEKESELGIIRYQELLGYWRPIFLSPELAPSQMKAIKAYCDKFHYPSEWATPPPKNSTNSPEAPNSANSSQAPNSQPHSHHAPISHPDSNKAGSQLQHVSAGSRTRTIALLPRRVVRSLKPGFTSTGDRIRMIQHLGLMGARFVVEDANGRIRLMSSAATGGQLAIDGAKSAGVPDTLRGDKEVNNLRIQIRATFGGTYGLNWVAVGEVNSMCDKSPYMVVGFFHEGPGGNPPLQEVGLSRSALKKILSPKEADRLISEALTYDPDIALQDAISDLSGLSLKSGGHSSQLPDFGLPAPRDTGYLPHVPNMAPQLGVGSNMSQPASFSYPVQQHQFGYSQQPNMP
ncbi:hypothetical protein PENARI_c021G04569 [Penicillium arizonense]|uniref:J domain-containing protein n=1 Tax=Penicillium arizonense TaxID=1835702 RepID=A0A1F5L8H1_PENAI|nr:hypothetical protein PENARI_c021G04569 [Penicillium arizonense]OGE49514.1 hypothetical protein PENARI_c021G04569 [Penicillium arizonense]